MTPQKKHLVDQVDGLVLSEEAKKRIKNFLCLHEFELSKDELPTEDKPWNLKTTYADGVDDVFQADSTLDVAHFFAYEEHFYEHNKQKTVIAFVGDEHLPTGKKFEAIWL